MLHIHTAVKKTTNMADNLTNLELSSSSKITDPAHPAHLNPTYRLYNPYGIVRKLQLVGRQDGSTSFVSFFLSF